MSQQRKYRIFGYWLMAAIVIAGTKAIAQQKQDTTAVKILLDKFSQLRMKDSSQARAALEEAEAMALATKDNSTITRIQLKKCLLNSVDLHQCIDCIEQVRSSAKPDVAKSVLAEVYVDLAYQYGQLAQQENRVENTSKELEYYFKALRILESHPNPRLQAGALANVGSTYLEVDDRRSLEYLEKAIQIKSKHYDSVRLVNDFTTLAVAHAAFNDRIKAIRYTHTALRLLGDSKDNRRLSINHGNLGVYYSSLSEDERNTLGLSISACYDLALLHAGKAIDFTKYTGSEKDLAARYALKGGILVKTKTYNDAFTYLRNAKRIAHKHKNLAIMAGIHESLAESHAAAGHYDSAFMYAREIPALKDSINKDEIRKEVMRRQLAFEFDKKEDQYKFNQLMTEQQIYLLQLQQSAKLQDIRWKDAALQLSLKNKKVQDLAILNTATELKNSRLATAEKEQKLAIMKQEREVEENRYMIQQSRVELQRRQIAASKKELLYLAVAICLIVALFGLLVFTNTSRQKQKLAIDTERKKRDKYDADRRMAEFEMHGLRAQLNPHFMFNSLNSIQEQILKEENEKASDYLTTFARMLRQLLENASQPFINLEAELQFTQLYLYMEQLRMPDLVYDIYIDPAIDKNNILVPNMMLQPYLENAIWHGLLLKQGSRKIEMRLVQKDENVLITIKDNGIGRSKAAVLNKAYRKEHQLAGLDLLRKRFNLIQTEYGSEIAIEVLDLEDIGSAPGTLITITIPANFSDNLQHLLSRNTHLN